MRRFFNLTGLAMALVACEPTSEVMGAGGGEAFVFSSLIERSFAIRVVDVDGVALPGVSVSIEDVYEQGRNDGSAREHCVYLSGLTDADGLFHGTARLPSLEFVDVIVHDDFGRLGPWTDAELRDHLGYFAPSSRQQVSMLAGDVELFVTLTEVL